MKDEIKEKLDYFRKYATLYENIIINKIEDYITTLQEEKEDYKSRCEKAGDMIKFIAYNSERPLTMTELNKVYYILYGKERHFTKEELKAEENYYKRHQVPFKENYKDYYKGNDDVNKEVPLKERIEKLYESGYVNEFNYLQNQLQEARYLVAILHKQTEEKDKEIEKLKNIIDKIEKEFEEVFSRMKEKQVEIGGRGYYYTDLIPIEDILEDIKELKGSDK